MLIKNKDEQISDIEESVKKWQNQYKKAAESRDEIEGQLLKLKG